MNYLLEKQRPAVLGAEHPYAWIFKRPRKSTKSQMNQELTELKTSVSTQNRQAEFQPSWLLQHPLNG